MHNYSQRVYTNMGRLIWDGVFANIAFPLAVWATYAIHIKLDWISLLWIPMLYTTIFLFSMSSHGLYETATFTYQDRTLRGVTSSCLAASAMCVLFLLFMPQTQSNTDFLAFYTIIGILVLSLRYFAISSLNQKSGKFNTNQILLAGTPEQMQEYLFYLDKTSFQVNPIGFLSELPSDKVRNLPRLGGLEDLSSVLQIQVVDEVVLALPQNCTSNTNPLLQECARRGLLVKVALDVWNAEQTKCFVHSVGPIPVLIYHQSNLSSVQKSLKRITDIIGSMLGIIILLIFSLFMIPVMIIKNQRPIFYKRFRLGKNGRDFRQIEFCITKPNVNPASISYEDLTELGKFLLKTKLRYLPSFINVFMGDMSIVGTRGSTDEEPSFDHNVSLKPGLTGLWHIKDFDRTYSEKGLRLLDHEYVSKWNLLMDFRIILLTPLIHFIHFVIGQEDQEGKMI